MENDFLVLCSNQLAPLQLNVVAAAIGNSRAVGVVVPVETAALLAIENDCCLVASSFYNRRAILFSSLLFYVPPLEII